MKSPWCFHLGTAKFVFYFSPFKPFSPHRDTHARTDTNAHLHTYRHTHTYTHLPLVVSLCLPVLCSPALAYLIN